MTIAIREKMAYNKYREELHDMDYDPDKMSFKYRKELHGMGYDTDKMICDFTTVDKENFEILKKYKQDFNHENIQLLTAYIYSSILIEKAIQMGYNLQDDEVFFSICDSSIHKVLFNRDK